MRDHQIHLGKSNNNGYDSEEPSGRSSLSLLVTIRWDRLTRCFCRVQQNPIVAPRRIYRTAPLHEQTSYDVESMILACASSFSCDPPRGPPAFQGYRPVVMPVHRVQTFFPFVPFCPVPFLRGVITIVTPGLRALFRKFLSANSRTPIGSPLLFTLLHHRYAIEVDATLSCDSIYGCIVTVLLLDGAYIICNYTACKTILVIPTCEILMYHSSLFYRLCITEEQPE